jgi:hypothetical protein
MRYVSIIALLASTTALAGCAGGDGSALSLAASGPVCGVNDPNCATPTPVTAVVVPTKVVVPPPVLPPPPPPNIGNAVKITTGDTTIALEKSLLVSPKTNPALSKLTITSSPSTAKFEINTQSPNNALWPIAKTMELYRSGTGLDGTYKEYRALATSSTGTASDEELQVWSWNNSYATQYRDLTGADKKGEAVHQAWSFGGTRTAKANMPVSGNPTYNGKFAATAKTWNWENSNSNSQTIDFNTNWRVSGTSSIVVDFTTATVSGTLNPLIWNAYQDRLPGPFKDVIATDTTDPNNPSHWGFVNFMTSDILLNGTITTSATGGNSITGSTSIDPNDGWVSNSTLNPFYGAFFDDPTKIGTADPVEVTGIFAVEASLPDPSGGDTAINGDRRNNIEISGVFNGHF